MTTGQSSDEQRLPLERAEEMVAQLERRAADKALWLFARAIEEAQDIWAEAQALRARSRMTE